MNEYFYPTSILKIMPGLWKLIGAEWMDLIFNLGNKPGRKLSYGYTFINDEAKGFPSKYFMTCIHDSNHHTELSLCECKTLDSW